MTSNYIQMIFDTPKLRVSSGIFYVGLNCQENYSVAVQMYPMISYNYEIISDPVKLVVTKDGIKPLLEE